MTTEDLKSKNAHVCAIVVKSSMAILLIASSDVCEILLELFQKNASEELAIIDASNTFINEIEFNQ